MRGLRDMRVGLERDDARPAPPRFAFWSLGRITPVELMATVGILAMMVGIMVGTMSG
jgi:hypothetical protein